MNKESEKTLTEEIAEKFVEKCWSVELKEYAKIEDAAAKSLSSLSQHEGILDLSGLTELSEAAAEKLSLFPGSILNLRGLRKLSAVGAESLAKYDGDLNLTQELQAKVDSFKD